MRLHLKGPFAPEVPAEVDESVEVITRPVVYPLLVGPSQIDIGQLWHDDFRDVDMNEACCRLCDVTWRGVDNAKRLECWSCGASQDADFARKYWEQWLRAVHDSHYPPKPSP